MGRERPYAEYTKMVGLDFDTLKASREDWCYKGQWPKEVRLEGWEGRIK